MEKNLVPGTSGAPQGLVWSNDRTAKKVMTFSVREMKRKQKKEKKEEKKEKGEGKGNGRGRRSRKKKKFY